MSTTVEQIKAKLSIVDVVSSYIELQKAGSNFKGKCPFHNEKSPSFFVSPTRGSFYCFGCGAKGDIFTFVEQFESQDFLGSLKILAARAGVEIVHENPKAKSERDRLFSILEIATIFFQRTLVSHKEALAYLRERGLTTASMSEWRLGFAPNDWRTLHDHLLAKGFTVGEMDKAGLVKKSEKGDYDRFRSRIIFPIADSSGRIVGFSGRIFGVEGDAKYLNSPETPLFKKSEILYGFDKAKLEIRRKGFVVLVEGQMDLLMAHQAKTTNTTATSGTALTGEHLSLLKRLTNTIVLAFDSDKAGVLATTRSSKEALSMGLEVKVAVIASGKDPADCVKTDPLLWQRAVENPVHIIEYEFDRLKESVKDPREHARAIEKTILPYIAALESTVEKSHFIKRIAYESGIKEEALWEDLKKISQKVSKGGEVAVEKKTERKSRFDYLERRAVGLIEWLLTKGEKETAQALEKKIENIIGKGSFDLLRNELKEYNSELILEAELYFERQKDREREIGLLFEELERDHLKKEFTKTLQELSIAEAKKDVEKAGSLMQKLKTLSTRMGT